MSWSSSGNRAKATFVFDEALADIDARLANARGASVGVPMRSSPHGAAWQLSGKRLENRAGSCRFSPHHNIASTPQCG
jgi:hypothetical protein